MLRRLLRAGWPEGHSRDAYDYKTGEMHLHGVQTPTYDPQDPPEIADDDPQYEGVYVNRLLSATFVPGSIFKTVTTAAAIDHIGDLQQRTFHCDGEMEIGGAKIACYPGPWRPDHWPGVHGILQLCLWAAGC